MTIVLSQLRIFTVVSDTSSTAPSASNFGTEIQSPTFTMSLAESWMLDTKPRMLSRKINISTAAEAPRLVSRMVGDLSIRTETARMKQTSSANPCAVCRRPLIGLFCHDGLAATIWNEA